MNKLSLKEKFVKRGKLAYYILKHETGAAIIVGLLLDHSIDSNSFLACYFVQCLYDPFSTYNLSLGERIGSYWNNENIQELQALINELNVFASLTAFDDVVALLNKHPYYGEKTVREVYLAMTYFILKEYDKAQRHLAKILQLKSTTNYDIFSEEIKKAQFIKDCIKDNDYNRGIAQLIQWQEHTIKELGIEI